MTAARSGRRPDIVLILADDMGYSDLGCFGGDIDTPVLDRIAADGVRFTQFYNSPRCSPTRASLLTGLHPHQVGIGILTGDERSDGYAGDLAEGSHTIAELLGASGYRTYMSGKWHLSADMETPTSSWPNRRGFDRVFGTIEGAGSYFTPVSLHEDERDASVEWDDPDFYYTEAIGRRAAGFIADHAGRQPDQPLFLYAAFTAPHWPLHAPEAEISRYEGRFDEGWDVLRERRLQHMQAQGLLPEDQLLSPRDSMVPAWDDVDHKGWQASRMEVYAAQVTAMDRAVGEIVDALAAAGRLDDALIVFLSDNGACEEEMPPGGDPSFAQLPMVPRSSRDGRPVRLANSEEVEPGGEDTFTSYGREWANVSAAPFREYKHWVHEGGISTPLIVSGPAVTEPRICHEPAQLVDLLPTFLELAGAHYPPARGEHAVPAPEGISLSPVFGGEALPERPLFWEHEGNAAVRVGRWKLVRRHGEPWALHDMRRDRAELTDLSPVHPEIVRDLAQRYDDWAARVGVIPRQRILEAAARRRRNSPA